MNESQKWMEIMKRFSNTCKTGRDATNTHILMEEGFDFGARVSFRII